MPYGMPKGMETAAMDKKMEDCVNQVMKQGHDKVSAIKICKASMIKAHLVESMQKKGK